MVKYKHIGVRFPVKEREFLEIICRTRGENISTFARRSILKEMSRLLDEKQKKVFD